MFAGTRRPMSSPSRAGRRASGAASRPQTKNDVLLDIQRSAGNAIVRRILDPSSQSPGDRAVAPGIQAMIGRARGMGRGLDESVRRNAESVFATDFTSVRVHTGSIANRLNEALDARAFTVGADIFFRDGEYEPSGGGGKDVLAHELVHVAQQSGGTVQPASTISEPGDADERTADRIGHDPIVKDRLFSESPPDAAVPHVIPAMGPSESARPRRRPAHPHASRSPVEQLSPLSRRLQRQAAAQTVPVQLVGSVNENRLGAEVHRVGDNVGPNILLDIERGPDGAVVYRWFNFETGRPITGTARDWSFLGLASAFARSPEFERLGRQLSPAEWRRLWPNPVPELLRRFEAHRLAIDDAAILGAYRGQVREAARTQLDDNERQIDELLRASDRVARLQEYADGLREASQVRDRLEARRADLQHSLVQAQSFTFGIAGTFTNMDPARRLRTTMELRSVDDAIAGWNAAFPLLTRLATAEINSARVEQTLQTIKANIVATRPRLAPNGLDPMELEGTRALVARTLGPRASAVVEAEDRSRRRRQIIGGIAGTAAMIAILFLPGGVFIDAAIGVAIAAMSWEEARIIGQAANTGLHVDDGLMTQAQANAARWHAILATVFAALGAAGAAFRVLRVAKAFLNVRRALPELEFAQHAQLARALSRDEALLRTLTGPAARDDAFILTRLRAAAREVGRDPAALRRSLETTGVLARLPRRIAESDAYSPIRAITDGSDIEAVARVTGLTRQEVEAAKRHFMLDEHILVDEAGQAYRGRFVADAEDGRLWLSAARGRRLAPGDIARLRRLIVHEAGEARVLAGQLRTLEDAFVRRELEGMLRRFLARHLSPAQVEVIMRQETRPIMPFRYAHYVAHFTGAPNP